MHFCSKLKISYPPTFRDLERSMRTLTPKALTPNKQMNFSFSFEFRGCLELFSAGANRSQNMERQRSIPNEHTKIILRRSRFQFYVIVSLYRTKKYLKRLIVLKIFSVQGTYGI